MKKIVIAMFLGIAVFSTTAQAAQWIYNVKIANVRWYGNSGFLTIHSTENPYNCNTARHIYFTTQTPGYEHFLKMGLTAHSLGKNVDILVDGCLDTSTPNAYNALVGIIVL